MRLTRSTDTTRRERGRQRAPAGAPVPNPKIPPAPSPRSRGTDPLAAERRMRDSGGPEDNATYGCACGMVFEAPVSTGVNCPTCGAPQAW